MSARYCEQHDLIVSHDLPCPACAAAERRNTIDMHQARIADLEHRLLRTNRIVVELVKRIQRDQAAHNALARASERLLTQVEQVLAESQRERAASHVTPASLYVVDCACGFHKESHIPMGYVCCPRCGASVVI